MSLPNPPTVADGAAPTKSGAAYVALSPSGKALVELLRKVARVGIQYQLMNQILEPSGVMVLPRTPPIQLDPHVAGLVAGDNPGEQLSRADSEEQLLLDQQLGVESKSGGRKSLQLANEDEDDSVSDNNERYYTPRPWDYRTPSPPSTISDLTDVPNQADLDDEVVQLVDPSQPSFDGGLVSQRHEQSNSGLSSSSDISNHGLGIQLAGADILHGSQKTQSQRSATTPNTTPSPTERQPPGVPSRYKLPKGKDHCNKQLLTKWRKDYSAHSNPLDPAEAAKIIADTRTSIIDLYLRENRTTSRAMNLLGEQATHDPLIMNLLDKSAREKDAKLEKVYQVYLKYAKQEIKNPGSRKMWFPRAGGRNDENRDNDGGPPRKKRKGNGVANGKVVVIKLEDDDGISSSPYNLRVQTRRLRYDKLIKGETAW
ncbi:MAG: hypothetical protein Q9198_002514 [Flavoplaca austrocitrina]